MKNHLPTSAKLALLINGSFGLVPIFIMIVGIFMSIGLLQDLDIQATIYLSGDTETGKGRIVNVFETNLSINEEPVLGYDYIFDSPIGPLEWTSYSSTIYYEVDDEVNIEYNADHPDYHRIAGMTSSLGGGATIFFIIPFLVGLIWFMINITKGKKKIRVITHGKIARGELVSKEATNTRINEQTVYKLTFCFKADDGRTYEVSAKTHKPHKLEDEHQEVLIYDPLDPSKAFLADNLPWGVPKLVRGFES